MEKHEAMNDVLNDLVKINNDRITGYENAIKDSKSRDTALKDLFEQMKQQSIYFKQDLAKLIQKDEGIVEDDTTSSGKIYRAWMEIKAAVSDNEVLSILASCEFGEDAAMRAYQAALTSDAILDPVVYLLIKKEKTSLERSHTLIRQQLEFYKMLQSH